MSYSISLYDSDFLKNAIDKQLGDWTSAPVLREDLIEDFKTILQKEGFINHIGEFVIENKSYLAITSIFPGEIVISIPYSTKSSSSIAHFSKLLTEFAEKWNLGYHDPHAVVEQELNTEVIDELIQNIKSKDYIKRKEALNQADYFAHSNPKLVVELSNLIVQLNEDVKLAILHILESIEELPKDIAPILIKSLEDNDMIKCSATLILGNLGRNANSAIQKLEKLTDSNNYAVKGRAVEALEKIKKHNSM